MARICPWRFSGCAPEAVIRSEQILRIRRISRRCRSGAAALIQIDALHARLGGYLNRKNDGPPGHQVVWERFTRLVTGARTIERIEENGKASALYPFLARNG